MSENAINDIETPLWRSGPPEKPVLCNACGSRWRTRGTLEDYIPKHAIKDPENDHSGKLPSKLNQISSSSCHSHEQPPILESNIAGQELLLPVLGDGTGNGESTPIGATFSDNFTRVQTIEEAVEFPLWDGNNVFKRKRSILDQHIMSPTEMLHQQLYYALQDSQAAAGDYCNGEEVLIFERINHYIPENEIGLGCILLQPPASPTKNFKPQS
ncbi:GATA transcription factor 26-like [Coffea arabica]|uniref:GATA transcription factor 26-like n=1 Tax=Coffea arabica TaxID=13443 RepID=A0A6P6VJL4_COFAR|nr:GATA transcription factor 26-like [Coffea arabica]